MADDPVKVVFIGCVESSAVALKALLKIPEVELQGIVTCRNSDFNTDHVCLEDIARSNGVPVFLTDEHDDRNTMDDWIARHQPLAVFCVGWSWLLGSKLLSICEKGVIGYHPAALPQNRGRHPLIWALALGLENTASTFFVMNERADAGPIISQVAIPIGREDDARTLYDKMLREIPGQIEAIVGDYLVGGVAGLVQDESQANVWRKRSRADGRIDWRMGPQAIQDLVRALTRPYPGAHVEYRGREIKVWRAETCNAGGANCEPGKVVAVEGSTVIVRCYGGAIRLIEHTFETVPETGSYL